MVAHRIDYLLKSLDAAGWSVDQWFPGDRDDAWRVAVNWRNGTRVTLQFQGQDDLEILPLERSYGVFVEEAPGLNLYLGGARDRRERRFDEFAQALTRLAQLPTP